MNKELEVRNEEVRELHRVVQGKEALLTHIAVASSEVKVHELMVRAGMSGVKEMRTVQGMYEQEALKVVELTKANLQLQSDLEHALGQQVPDLEDVLQRIRSEMTSDFQSQLDQERAAHQQALSAANKREMQLLLQLESEQLHSQTLQNSISQSNFSLKQKITTLERSLEQLQLIYNQVNRDKHKIIVEMNLLEKKMKRKEEEMEKLKGEMRSLREEMEEIREKEREKPAWREVSVSSHIHKAIKGGHHLDLFRDLHIPLAEIPELNQSRSREMEEERLECSA